MKSIFTHLSEIETSNKPAALCIVVDTKGSSPRKAGSKMIVFDDGQIIGSIGGGAIEKEVISKALDVIKKNEPLLQQFNLANDVGMACGGNMTVYIEPLINQKHVYIFGAGHIGHVLSELAIRLGFKVTVIDEREQIFQQFSHEQAEKWNIHYAEAIEKIRFDNSTYIIIMTHKHINDEAILRLVCKKPAGYIGMIGSRSKVKELKQQLINEGVLTESEFAQIDTPIGVPIACETPAEIAVSILAKIIDVRNSQNK